MSVRHNEFRERLLKSEQINQECKDTYKKEVEAMFQVQLSPWRKKACAALSLFFMLEALFLGYLVVFKELPFVAVAAFTTVIIFSIILSIITLTMAFKGTVRLKTNPTILTCITFGPAIIVMLIIMLSGPYVEPGLGAHMAVCGLFVLIVSAAYLIIAFIQRSELNTREKLLEIEYRVAEMAETIAKIKE